MAENKIKYGLKNLYYAVLTSDSEGTAVFDTPVAIPGAVSLSLSQVGELTKFYADNRAYYVSAANGGYEGEVEVARLPDSFRETILGETKDTDAGTLIEDAGAEPKPFALLFEFGGDVKETKHVMYNCSVTRPDVTGQTVDETKTPATEKFKIQCSALSNGKVKAQTLSDGTGTATAGWYTTVWQPGK